MKFITSKRIEEEGLKVVTITHTDEEGRNHIDWKITGVDGVLYDACVSEDGTIDHPSGRYSGPEAFDRSREPSELIGRKTGPYRESNLYRCHETGDFFEEQRFRSVGEPYISCLTQEEALQWFLDIYECDYIELLSTGHVAVSFSTELQDRIREAARGEDLSERDWIIGRLNECVRDERSVAGVAKIKKRSRPLRKVLEAIRQRRGRGSVGSGGRP